MPDRNYQAIVDALDVLARGASTKTNGKITSVNLAKEACVSRATVYRYLHENADLNEAYEAIRKNGLSCAGDAPVTLLEAYQLQDLEVRSLRVALNQCKKDAAETNKMKAHQIQLLWLENERLRSEVSRLQSLIKNNITALKKHNN